MMRIWLMMLLVCFVNQISAQDDAANLVRKLKNKLELVKDYAATGRMKTDVAFLKVPVARVKVYFKKPDKFRITREKGISILPKGGISVNMQHMLAEQDAILLDAGKTTTNGVPLRIIKILPAGDDGDVVITTLYIDEKNLLIYRASTTTKQNGTFDVELTYNKWANYSLPDKTVFSFNTKDYKLPKGVTMEFDDGERPDAERLKNKKGTVEILYQSYEINKGVPDSYFTQ